MTDLSPVCSGDELAALEAVRNAIVSDLEDCESMRDRTALYKQLQDVLKRISDVKPAEQKGDAVDEIAARRAARRSGGSSGSGRAKRAQ